MRSAQWPDIRDEHELHDHLQSLILVPEEAVLALAAEHARSAVDSWPLFFARLCSMKRATAAAAGGIRYWVTAERLTWARTLLPALVPEQALPFIAAAEEPADELLRRAVQAWMVLLGPATANSLATMLHIPASELWKQLLRLEVAGTLMRGVFEQPSPPGGITADHDTEWCDRRMLQRIQAGYMRCSVPC